MNKNNLVAATIAIVLLLCGSVSLRAGDHKTGSKQKFNSNVWKSTGFIQNTGQFTGIPGIEGKAVFGIDNPTETIIFTNKGVNFIYTVPVLKKGKTPIQTITEKLEKERDGDRYKDENDDILLKQKFNIVSMHWKGADPNVQVIAEDILPEVYYTNRPGEKIPYKSSIYKKITYKNLYPGIDVEYVLYEKGGMKYTFHVQPGADLSNIVMEYDNATPKLTEVGDIYLNTAKGIIIDHRPITFYGSAHTPVASFFSINKNEVHFNVGAYPANELLIIDPWTMSPGFTQLNKAYDIVRNNTTGELYAFGGYAPFEVKKLNASGALQWTYVTNPIYGGPSNNYYGDIAIDPAGDVYLSAGCCSGAILKISGVNSNTIWNATGYQEPWRMQFDVFGNRLIAAGYVGVNGENICSIDPNTGATTSAGIIIAPVNSAEIRAIIVEPTSSKVHALHVSQYPSTTLATNRVSGNTGAFVNFYDQQSNYLLGEIGSYYASCDNTFYCSNGQCFHGTNALAVTANFIYTYDGFNIFKRDINTGNQLATVNVPNGIAETNSGIVIDSCGNIFVGTQTTIEQYDPNLVFMSSIPTTGAVCDMVIGVNGEIISCGDGFIRSDYFVCGNFNVTTTGVMPLCNGQCNGTATAVLFGGTPPFTFLWSTTATTQSISGLCAGSYTVTVTDSTNVPITSVITITQPAPLTLGASTTQTPCGASTGTGTVSPTGGTGPYSFSWSPGSQTTGTATGLAAGAYTCYVTDANGCTQQQVINVPAGPGPSVTTTQLNANCFGQCFAQATANASSGTSPYTYSWNNGQTTQTATGLCVGNYTVYVTDLNGCSVTSQTVTITQPPAINSTTSVIKCTDELPNGSAIIFVSGGTPGYTYSWNTSPTQTTDTAGGLSPGSYVVYFWDNNNCPDSATVTMDICPLDSIHVPNVFSPNGDGMNDNFVIFNVGYLKLQCNIYNRWGNLIYSWDNPAGYWDGKVNGKTESDGTYYYIYHAEKLVGDLVDGKGYFQLLQNK